METLEVGMYVRTKHYGIFKILNIEKQNKIIFLKKAQGIDCVVADKYNPIEKEVIKASHNIIDLIEVGDYVNGIRIDSLSSNRFTGAKAVESNLLENDINRKCYFFENEDIKTILTKEQFENNCYILQDEEVK